MDGVKLTTTGGGFPPEKKTGAMRKKRTYGKIIAAAAALALLIGAILYGTALVERIQQGGREKELLAEREKLRPSQWTEANTVALEGELYGFDHRIETFLFVGTDLSGNSEPEEYRGAMADFLLLMVLDHTDNTYGYLQIDRNTITDVRELDKDGQEITSRDLQICTAHWYGRNPEMAAENTVDAVRRYLGGLARIDGYYVLNVEDAGKLNSAVGGVEVTIGDDLSALDPAMTKGRTLKLSDKQARIFLQARQNVGEGTNAERMGRQRQYMAAFFNRVKEKTKENPEFGLEVWNRLKDAGRTDMNGNDFSRIAKKILKGEDKGIRTVRGETALGTVLEDGELHEEFYADEASKREEMCELFSLVKIEE